MNQKPFIEITSEDGETIAIPNKEYNPLIENPHLYQSYLRLSKIPSDYWDIEFEDYVGSGSVNEVKKVIQYAEHFFDPEYEAIGLYLYGPNRTQKTTLATCVGKEVLKQGKRVLYLQAGDFQKYLKNEDNFDPDPDMQRIVTNIYEGFYALIIIDDIFDEKKQLVYRQSANFFTSMWNVFFNMTLKNKQKMILTSNTPLNKVGDDFSKDIEELIKDYLYPLEFLDSSKDIKRERLKNLFD